MNSWYGKFHLEMHWWHGVHFALWNRAPLLEKSLGWYRQVAPLAPETSRWQGYDGIRWQKMTGPEGRKTPSSVGELLVWQQPHIIYFAELLYVRILPVRCSNVTRISCSTPPISWRLTLSSAQPIAGIISVIR